MKLADWLEKNDMQRKVFAEKIGVNPSYITLICNSDSWPSRDIMKRIKKATKGEVTPNDFLDS